MCTHQINELCVCIVRVHKPSVYISKVTWPWKTPGSVSPHRWVVGKRGDLLSQLLRPLHWSDGGADPAAPLPAGPIHIAACCLFITSPPSKPRPPSSRLPPPSPHLHKYTSLLRQCFAWQCVTEALTGVASYSLLENRCGRAHSRTELCVWLAFNETKHQSVFGAKIWALIYASIC